MRHSIQQRILEATHAHRMINIEVIQPLWNHYGVLSRLTLQRDSQTQYSVILKHIQIPSHHQHPKGFASSIAHQRKIKSYYVEQYWYQNYNEILVKHPTTSLVCHTPICIDTFHIEGEIFILLEDLTTVGFYPASHASHWKQVEMVIQWLAYFHAQFLHHPATGLWTQGCYWHLATRPDELKEIQGSTLHWMASIIDAQLSTTSFQTLVHGDAKLANFCFHDQENSVAAVDFQYIGRGCGMKDLAYFVGSVFDEDECAQYETQILTSYFSHLRTALQGREMDTQQLEKEWRALYHVCWVDFQRFLLGWSPTHNKHNRYTQALTQQVVHLIIDELLQTALQACREAGLYIISQWNSSFDIKSKGFDRVASDLVTSVDLQAQTIIINLLKSTMQKYNFGLLTEESEDHQSRLNSHAFWVVDPLDGTRYFAQGASGFAVSIALVSQAGDSLIGVVYDPVEDYIYHAIKGYGFYKNEIPWSVPQTVKPCRMTRYADVSLKDHEKIDLMRTQYDIKYAGGAVLNLLHVITNPKSFYAKTIRSSVGGCAIWDIAAVILMLSEVGGVSSFFDGTAIHLNGVDSCYFHDVGLLFFNADITEQEKDTLTVL